jgi:hypothetical protein
VGSISDDIIYLILPTTLGLKGFLRNEYQKICPGAEHNQCIRLKTLLPSVRQPVKEIALLITKDIAVTGRGAP